MILKRIFPALLAIRRSIERPVDARNTWMTIRLHQSHVQAICDALPLTEDQLPYLAGFAPNDPHGANVEWLVDREKIVWRGEWAEHCWMPWPSTDFSSFVLTRERIGLFHQLLGTRP